MGNERYYTNRRTEMAQFLPRHYRTVLEVGCGEAGFAENLDPSCEYWGVERHNTAAVAASRRAQRVLVGDYMDVETQLPDGYFDLVICNDVIEHMPDHDAFLSKLRMKMKDGGSLVASIPNMRYYYCLRELLLSKDWVYQDHGIMDRTHLRFFTENSIRRSMTDNGFEIEVMHGLNRLRGLKKMVRALFFVVLTFGYYRDILYQQFGLRAIYRTRNHDGDTCY